MRKELLFSIILFFIIFLISGCKDNSTEPIPTNYYPLSMGTRLEYNSYDINAAGDKVANTDTNIVRTVGSPITLNGLSAYPVTDEYYKGTNFVRRITNYISKDPSSGDVKYLIALSYEVIPGVTLGVADWFTFFKPSADAGVSYTVYKKDTTVDFAGIPVSANINITGKILGEEQVTVPIQTQAFTAKRVDINIKVIIQGSVTLADDLFFQQWLVDGIGPIKEKGPVGNLRKVGYTFELTKKNF